MKMSKEKGNEDKKNFNNHTTGHGKGNDEKRRTENN